MSANYSGSINSNSILRGSREVETIFPEKVALELLHNDKGDFPSQRIRRKKLQCGGGGETHWEKT